MPVRLLGVGMVGTVLLVAGGLALVARASTGIRAGINPNKDRLVEPSLSVLEAQTILEDPAIRTDPEVAPWLGFSVEGDDGSLYNYDGASWVAVTPGGDLWGLPGSTAEIIESPAEVRVSEVTGDETEWVQEVLDSTPGLDREGDHYAVADYTLFRDGFIQVAAEKGVVIDEGSSGSATISKPQATSFVWVEPSDDHVWFIDDTAAVLAVQSGEELAVAGQLVPDGVSGAVWEPLPDTQNLSGSVDQVLSNIDGVVQQGGRSKIPFKVFVPGEAPAIRADKIPTDRGPTVEVRKFEPPPDRCNFWSCVIHAVGGVVDSTSSGIASGFERGWNGTVNATGSALANLDPKTLDCVFVGTICQLRTAQSLARVGADAVTAVWKVRGNIFREKACDGGSPGPGRGRDGNIDDYAYPAEKKTYDLNGVRTLYTDDWPSRLDLAREWMPQIELSKDEQCGEILRVFAKVHAYGSDGEQATSLARAVRVEIVYTLFFKEDGGRFEVLGTGHPGDNEGFVIGLVRTNNRSGLCATGFELAAGRTVGHKDAVGPLQKYLQATDREIDDFDAGDVGAGCPQPEDSRYRLLVSEAKHATYFRRQVCEDALVPDLPVLVGGFLGGGPVGAAIAKQVVDLAPANVQHNLRNGLEECESGRQLISLASRVELFDEELLAGHPDDLGFRDTYQTEDGVKSFADTARGRWCFGRDAATLPRVPNCIDDYHVPGFFEYASAEPGTPVPSVVNLTEQEARMTIETAGLELAVTSQRVDHPNGDGIVITQTPAAGSEVAPGTVVRVRVGVYTQVIVPDVLGDTVDGARASIEALDLIYASGGTVELSSAQATFDGLVVDQDPSAGAQVVPGTRVRVYVGSYAPPSKVAAPNLFGDSTTAARNQIESLGLVYVYAGEVAVSQSNLGGLVVDQEPSPGTSLPQGGSVTVYVGRYVPARVSVPDLGGLSESTARDRVEQAGLIFQVAGTSETSASMVGRVLDQDPISGTVEVGSTIRVWIGVAEPAPSFPSQKTSSWVAVSITGGHGSLHSVGDQVDVCFSWARLSGEPPGVWQLWDFQPPQSSGVMITDGSMYTQGSDCFSASISVPTGYEEIVIVARYYDYSTDTWQMRDWANVMIYVTD